MKKYLLIIVLFVTFYSHIAKSDELMTQIKLDQLLEEVAMLRQEVYDLKDDVNRTTYWAYKNNSFLVYSLMEIIKSDLSKKEIEDKLNKINKNYNKTWDDMQE